MHPLEMTGNRIDEERSVSVQVFVPVRSACLDLGQNLQLPSLAGKENDLSPAGPQISEGCLQPLVIVHGKGLIQKDRDCAGGKELSC